MAKQTGYLWAVIQEWLDSDWNPPSQNKLAARLGVSASALTDYKYAVHMPPPEFIDRLAVEIQVPRERVLDAVLKDHRYRPATTEEVNGKHGRPPAGHAPLTDAEQRQEDSAVASVEAAVQNRQAGADTKRESAKSRPGTG